MVLFVDEMKFSDIVKSPISFRKSGVYYTDDIGRIRMRKGKNHITCQFYKGREHTHTLRLDNPSISAPSKKDLGGLYVWATTLYGKDGKYADGFHIYSKTRAEAREVNRKLRETFSL